MDADCHEIMQYKLEFLSQENKSLKDKLSVKGVSIRAEDSAVDCGAGLLAQLAQTAHALKNAETS